MATSGIDTSELQRLQRDFKEFGARLSNRTQANAQVSQELYQFVIRNFDQEGELVGGWAPLAESTVKQKRRIGKEKPLIRTGQLRNSFVPFHGRDEAGVRSLLPYAIFHEQGTSRMPQRRLTPDGQQVLEIAVPIYKDFVDRAFEDAFTKRFSNPVRNSRRTRRRVQVAR